MTLLLGIEVMKLLFAAILYTGIVFSAEHPAAALTSDDVARVQSLVRSPVIWFWEEFYWLYTIIAGFLGAGYALFRAIILGKLRMARLAEQRRIAEEAVVTQTARALEENTQITKEHGMRITHIEAAVEDVGRVVSETSGTVRVIRDSVTNIQASLNQAALRPPNAVK